MKKKWLCLLLPSLLLASCGVDSKKVIEDSKAAVAALEAPTYTEYSYSALGNVIEFDGFHSPKGSDVVPSGDVGQFGESYVLKIPTLLTAKNFYPEDDTKEDPAGYAYGYLQTTFESNTDHRHKMDFYKEGDNLVFESKNISMNLSFYHVEVTEGSYKKPVKVYGRYNMKATYNKYGLLICEEAQTVNVGKDPVDQTVNMLVNYTYTA